MRKIQYRVLNFIQQPFSLDKKTLSSERIWQAKVNLESLTFSHITRTENCENIKAHGLKADFGGSNYGVCGVDSAFKSNSTGHIHLGKDDCSILFMFAPKLRPSNFYSRYFKNEGIDSTQLYVVIPSEPVFSPARAERNADMLRNSGIFNTSNAISPLISAGCIDKDWADPLPGRFKTKDIPPQFILFKPLAMTLRKPGDIGADEYISPEILDRLVPQSQDKTESKQERIEALRSAAHGTNNPIYPPTRQC